MERAESGKEQQTELRTRRRRPGARPASRRNGCGAASKIGTESFPRALIKELKLLLFTNLSGQKYV